MYKEIEEVVKQFLSEKIKEREELLAATKRSLTEIQNSMSQLQVQENKALHREEHLVEEIRKYKHASGEIKHYAEKNNR